MASKKTPRAQPSGAITFLVPGQRSTERSAARARTPLPMAGDLPGQLKDSVRLSTTRTAGAEPVRVVAVPGRDVVVLRLANGPTLLLHPENARDLMLAQGTVTRTARSGTSAAADDAITVPMQLRWRGLEQAAPTRSGGFLGQVLLSAFELITGLAKEPAARLLATQVVKKLDSQVEAGVYALNPAALPALKGSGKRLPLVPSAANPASEPLLVLIHGTFVDTHSTFGKLWALHPQQVQALFNAYAGRVYALDHPTLGVSPIANALTLVQALPAGARLHLVTHSRGGLVAEVLCRLASQPTLGPDDLAFFEGRAFAAQRAELQALAQTMRDKGIQVQRVLRVACPARGTLLASKRLDAYLSVLQWSIQLAGVPVLPQLLDFLAEVARRRADPEELPGLAAMIPDTPLLNWLNGSTEPVAGELRVLAGDLEGDSLGSWLKTLLADAYYWTDNDIVVQTRSMYGGSPRLGGAQFLLDQGAQVTHFNYFVNERSVAALVQGLTQDAPAGFRPIGPLSWAGQDAGGLRANLRARQDGRTASELPAVFVLPGILGSHLKADGHRIWLSLRLVGGLSKLQYTGRADAVEPDGPVGLVYDSLCEYLSDSHEVIAFGFDWRRPIEEEAQRLADAVEQALDARAASQQPVRLLAHSMGGVLARTLQLERPQTFARLMQHADARLLMLGTPNGGSWAPMQVLSGDDTFGNALAAFGSPLRDHQARQMMAEMPGFIQLQAALDDPRLQLHQASTWAKLAADDLKQVQDNNWWHRHAGEQQDAAYAWGLPPQQVLQQARRLRQRLDQQLAQDLAGMAARMLLVVGRARFTPAGFEVGEQGFVYLNASHAPATGNGAGGAAGTGADSADSTGASGDGRVTLESARLAGVRTWQMDADHGSLPQQRQHFKALLELLQSGDTDKLQRLADWAPARRGAGAGAGVGEGVGPAARVPAAATARGLVPSRPSRARASARPAEQTDQVLRSLPWAAESAARPQDADAGRPLRVRLLNGNLSFARLPLLVGHTRSLLLTGTESAVNALLGGAMQEALNAGLYPDAPGSHQVFVNTRPQPDNPWQAPQPPGVVVVGLGEEGKLSEQDLRTTVRQGVLAWAQRVAEQQKSAAGPTPDRIDLAATLMGSGGMGMNAGTAARAIAQGVHEANQTLARPGNGPGQLTRHTLHTQHTRWPAIGTLTLVELYLERASDAWSGLQVLAAAAPGSYVIQPTIDSGSGPLRRQIDSGYRGADYDFIAATGASSHRSTAAGTPGDGHGGPPDSGQGDADTIQFTLDTKRARTEVKAQTTQGRLIRQMVASASQAAQNDPRIGRTLFHLLVPQEVEPFLSGTSRMLLELDDQTASIPWELLDTGPDPSSREQPPPWAIRTRLLRKLQTRDYRAQVQDASRDDAVLVIGEPAADPRRYPRLPGALREAQAVAQAFAQHSGGDARLTALLKHNSAAEVVNALFEQRYRIVHIAGHGEPVQRAPAPSQALISKGGVVLSDGCFLGADEIQNMRAVPELVFVNCCHLGALDSVPTPSGERQAVNRAEFAWGVAQQLIDIGVRCVIAAGWAVDDEPAALFAQTFYRQMLAGQPFVDAVAVAREAAWRADRQSNTWAAYQCYGDPHWVYRRSDSDPAATAHNAEDEFSGVSSPLGVALALEDVAVRMQWMHADARQQRQRVRWLEGRFGQRWGDMGAVAEAFAVACAACADNDAAIGWYKQALQSNDASASIKAHEQIGNLQVRRSWSGLQVLLRQHPAGWRPPEARLQQARDEILSAMRGLLALCGLQPTLERHSLCGSGWKRLALVERLAGNAADERANLQMARSAYLQAETLALQQTQLPLFYPSLNRMALDVLLHDAAAPWPGFDAGAQAALWHNLQHKTETDPDFFCYASAIEIDHLQAVASGTLAAQLPALLVRYAELHDRVSSTHKWASVADQAELVLAPRAAGDSAARQLLAALQGYATGSAS